MTKPKTTTALVSIALGAVLVLSLAPPATAETELREGGVLVASVSFTWTDEDDCGSTSGSCTPWAEGGHYSKSGGVGELYLCDSGAGCWGGEGDMVCPIPDGDVTPFYCTTVGDVLFLQQDDCASGWALTTAIGYLPIREDSPYDVCN